MAVSSKTKKKIIVASAVSVALLLFFLVVAPFTASAIVCDMIFNVRHETPTYLKFHLDDFDGLKADKYEFATNKGVNLVGYRYYVDDIAARGVVVIAHGLGGGGHNSYMDVAYYFATNGYDVFAYDATGNDESGGKGIKGLPQGVIDLHNALTYIKEIDALNDLPVMLWGHSWGGYSVSAVLAWHSEVKAIAAIAGFNRSTDLMEAQGVQAAGEASRILMPYVRSVERINFGNYASATAVNGFENSNAGIFIAHSADDTVVPIQYGLDEYYSTFANNSRFKFVRYLDKGHTNILYSEEYIDYMKEFYQWANDYFNGRTVTDEEILEYFNENLNRSIYCDGLDKQLFNQILDFYNLYV